MTTLSFDSAIIENAKAWPFQEAKALKKRLDAMGKTEGLVTFETGYGPSGPPHIGTFGEVARTSMVRHAFSALCPQYETRIISVSDDMDGMRKIPPVPNAETLEPYLQQPLSRVPDPAGKHASFAASNNAKLQEFLDRFGFDYNFISASDAYNDGRKDGALIRMLEVYDEVLDIILPTLGEERRQTYSPILPISPKTGRVLYVPLLERDAASGTIVYEDEDGTRTEQKVTGGQAKLQWKADWAGHWYAFDTDYEMSGEDLTESVRLSRRIIQAMGKTAPVGFNYQLFLDGEGKKISKTKGNGLTIEEWLRYAAPETLQLFNNAAPKKAKKLYFDIIPKTADEYWTHVGKYAEQEPAKQVESPAWHIHSGHVPTVVPPVSFALLLNIVDASGTSDPDVLRGFVAKYRPDASDEEMQALEPMLGYAVNYFQDFVLPKKEFRAPTDQERAALEMLSARLKELGEGLEEDAYQTAVFDAGKAQDYSNIRQWFTGLYEVVFGQSEGPRMGPFVKIYGAAETAALIDKALARAA
ncbi:MAG: lysine--tRNA ligase [Pseudomonadota bacterium]